MRYLYLPEDDRALLGTLPAFNRRDSQATAKLSLF